MCRFLDLAAAVAGAEVAVLKVFRGFEFPAEEAEEEEEEEDEEEDVEEDEEEEEDDEEEEDEK